MSFARSATDPGNETDTTGNEVDDDSCDPVYDNLVGLNVGSESLMFLAGMPLNSYKGIAIKTGLRTALALSKNIGWVKQFLQSKLWSKVGKWTRVTPGGLQKAYYVWLAVAGSAALVGGAYVEWVINARHAAWWNFCFGEDE